jgi:hypothetical protein
MAEWIDVLQWPAMASSIAAAYLVGSSRKGRRNAGFWIFLLSNILWLVWSVPEKAWALATLQLALGVMNVRGLFKSDT